MNLHVERQTKDVTNQARYALDLKCRKMYILPLMREWRNWQTRWI